MSDLVNPMAAMMANLPAPKDLALADKIQTISGFLPNLGIVQALSRLRREPFNYAEGTITLQHTVDKVDDLGKSLDMFPVDWEYLAMDWSSKRPLTTSDPDSDLWAKIVELSAADPQTYKWGFNLLIWLPEQSMFCHWFCNSKSTRYTARGAIIGEDDAVSYIQKPCTLFTKDREDLVGGRPVIYKVGEVVKCSTPFANVPDPERLLELQNALHKPQGAAESKEEEVADQQSVVR